MQASDIGRYAQAVFRVGPSAMPVKHLAEKAVTQGITCANRGNRVEQAQKIKSHLKAAQGHAAIFSAHMGIEPA